VITSQTHDANGLEVFRHTLIQAPVVIENNVWIGSGAIILPGVQIRQGSIVGSGSVVTRDVPENTIVVGVPARAIRRKDGE
jgi:acetyltransferase-like isoleucine patch superfamily enzyme